MTTMKTFARGFTLVELMVGMAIGLIAVLAMMNVMINAEEQKRTTTSGMDAQVNAALALMTLTRDVEQAGYGFSASRSIVGCALQQAYQGTITGSTSGSTNQGLPSNLVPVIITPGSSGAPDRIRVIFSNKASASVPALLAAPAFVPGSSKSFAVQSVRGISGPTKDLGGTVMASGDLMVAAFDTTLPCQLFEVTADPSGAQVDRADTGNWNPASFPNVAYGPPATPTGIGSALFNMGSFGDVAYTVNSNGDLTQTSFVLASNGTASYRTVTVQNNVVQLKALYGKDTDADGVADTWDTVTPTTNAGWLQLIAVRVAVVARSTQKEKEDVTTVNPSWDVGNADTVTGATTCGTSKCLSLKLDNLTDWKRYRYKTFDTTIPLRNMMWQS